MTLLSGCRARRCSPGNQVSTGGRAEVKVIAPDMADIRGHWCPRFLVRLLSDQAANSLILDIAVSKATLRASGPALTPSARMKVTSVTPIKPKNTLR